MTINKNKPLAKVFLPALLLTATLSLPVESMAAPSPNPRNAQAEKADRNEKKQKRNARKEVRQDRRENRQDRREVRQDRRENRQDRREVRQRVAEQKTAKVQKQKAAKVQKQRKADLDRQARLQREAQRNLQAERNRRAFLERQAQLNRQRERQAQLDRRAQLQRQAELNRRAQLQRQAELNRRAELQRQAEQQRYRYSRDRYGRYYRDNDGRFYRGRDGRYYDYNGRYDGGRYYGDRYVANRGRYNFGDLIAVDGHLTNEGYECQALRDDDGTLYMLVGNTFGLRTGDHARVVGRVVDGGHCDWEGTAFEVTDVRALWADRRHRSVYYHENYDGKHFGHRNNWVGRRARAFENRVERYGYYDRDRNRYADRYRNR